MRSGIFYKPTVSLFLNLNFKKKSYRLKKPNKEYFCMHNIAYYRHFTRKTLCLLSK